MPRATSAPLIFCDVVFLPDRAERSSAACLLGAGWSLLQLGLEGKVARLLLGVEGHGFKTCASLPYKLPGRARL